MRWDPVAHWFLVHYSVELSDIFVLSPFFSMRSSFCADLENGLCLVSVKEIVSGQNRDFTC